VLRSRRRARRWAIKTAVSDVTDRRTWGDWHFALSLRDALTELGERAVVDVRRGWYRDTGHLDDVVLVLRGTKRYEPEPSHLNLCWIISHPDDVSDDELVAYDRVFAASVVFPAQVRARWPGVEIATLLQCTDPARFRPAPDADVASDVLFVGNSRGFLRPIVRHALEAGLRPTIYGEGWEDLVPGELVAGRHVPNEQLHRYYASAGVVLNDHWPDMRAHGFLSNRLFDAAACGARILTDPIHGVEELLGDQVVVVDGPEALLAAVRGTALSSTSHFDPSQHSFLARARELVAAVEALESGAERRPERHRSQATGVEGPAASRRPVR
jgi:hypothetical protein